MFVQTSTVSRAGKLHFPHRKDSCKTMEPVTESLCFDSLVVSSQLLSCVDFWFLKWELKRAIGMFRRQTPN